MAGIVIGPMEKAIAVLLSNRYNVSMKLPFNIDVYSHMLLLLSALIKEVSFCSV